MPPITPTNTKSAKAKLVSVGMPGEAIAVARIPIDSRKVQVIREAVWF